jgi:hypothetical protein
VEAPTGGFFDSTQPIAPAQPYSAPVINGLIRKGEFAPALRALASVPPGHEVIIDVPADCDSHLLPAGPYAFSVVGEDAWGIPLKIVAQALEWLTDVAKSPGVALRLAQTAIAEDSVESLGARRALAFLLNADGAARVAHATSPGEVVVASSDGESRRVQAVPVGFLQPHLSLRRAFDNDFDDEVQKAEVGVDVLAKAATPQSLGGHVQIEYGHLWDACERGTKLGELQQQLGAAARDYNAKMVYLHATNDHSAEREAESLRRRVTRLKQKIDRLTASEAASAGDEARESLPSTVREQSQALFGLMSRGTFRWVTTFGLSVVWGLIGTAIASALGTNLASLDLGNPSSVGGVLQIGFLAGIGSPILLRILEETGWYNWVLIGVLFGGIVVLIGTALTDQTIQEEINLWGILGTPLIIIYDGCRLLAESRYPRDADVSGEL